MPVECRILQRDTLRLGKQRFSRLRSLPFQQLLRTRSPISATVGAWKTLARRSDVPSSSWTREVSCMARSE